MRRLTLSIVFILILSSSLVAQQAKIEIPQYTDQQRWNRAASLSNSLNVMNIAIGKAKGMTIEEIGNWIGRQFAASWSSAMTPQFLFMGFHRNYMTAPTAIMEITAATENDITFRMNRYYLQYFGDAGISYGVTVQEFEKVGMLINKAIAEHGGLQMEQKIDGMWWITTVSKKVGK